MHVLLNAFGQRLCSYLLDVIGVGEQHGEAINAQAPASSWRQTILHRCDEALIQVHGLIISLSLCLQSIPGQNCLADLIISKLHTFKYELKP